MKSLKNMLFLLLLVCGNSLFAQVEVNVQIARLEANKNLLVQDIPLEPSPSFSIGGDLLIGWKKLVPMVGAFYQQIKYNEGVHSGSQLLFPLGLIYRVRPSHTSFNLAINASIAPMLRLDETIESAGISEENSLLFQGRTGVAVYLDFITLHYDWWIPFSNRWENLEEKMAYQTFGIGIRF